MTAILDTITTTTTAPATAASTTTDPTARLMRVAALVGPLFLAAASVACWAATTSPSSGASSPSGPFRSWPSPPTASPPVCRDAHPPAGPS